MSVIICIGVVDASGCPMCISVSVCYISQEYDVPILRHLQDVRVQLSTVESTVWRVYFLS